jgi:hypothetical protein
MKLNLYKIAFKLSIFNVILVLGFAACKKRNAFNSEDGQAIVDITNIRSQTDLVMIEANEFVSHQFFLRGKPTASNEIQASTSLSTCALDVDTTAIYDGRLRFIYNGNVCNNLRREGQVLVSLINYPLKKWKDKGAVLKIEFVNYVVTNVSENTSLKINGVQLLSNESGGTWFDINYLNQTNLIHTITGTEIKVMFDKVNLVIYNVGRRISYSSKGLVVTASSEGASSQANKSKIEYWGTSRSEKDFTCITGAAIVWNTACSPQKPISGSANVTVAEKYFDLNANYGTNSEGKIVNGSDCPYGWELNWTLRNKTKRRVFNY